MRWEEERKSIERGEYTISKNFNLMSTYNKQNQLIKIYIDGNPIEFKLSVDENTFEPFLCLFFKMEHIK